MAYNRPANRIPESDAARIRQEVDALRQYLESKPEWDEEARERISKKLALIGELVDNTPPEIIDA